jgi:hypothetical protein
MFFTEDVIKNTTATAQLGSAAITAGFTDTVGSAMVYKRLGMSYTRGIKNAIVGTLKGLTKGQRKRIDELVDITWILAPSVT